MFLGSYHFDGDPDELVPAYRRLAAGMPVEQVELHVCAQGERGITVFDTCPSREVFDGFISSTGFADAVAAAGLPRPRIQPVGEVVNTMGTALRT